jgi:hypothetical protein
MSKLDEFTSVFRRAVIPRIEVSEIAVPRILLLAEGPLAGACETVADRLAYRFGSEVVRADAGSLARAIEQQRPSTIIAPEDEHTDALLIATPLPTLLIRKPEVDDIFDRIVAKIPGGRTELIEQFSIAFALCTPGGRVKLLHVLERNSVDELAQVLEITPEIDTESGAADLLAAAKTRMDHLLRGAVRTAEGSGITVEADLRTGDPFAIVSEVAQDCSLLIVGSQQSHTEFLESRAYAHMKRTPGVHLLAL